MAADWQESLTQLVTGAGEPVKAIGMIRSALLSMSVDTGTSVSDLTSGLYMISSAGYHGASGLKILQAAAEGARTGNASLADVSNVLTSAMNAYHYPASQAVAVTDQLVATVAAGKMHMSDLATSLSNVLPVAASAKISLAQVGGAIATMTMQGMTARRASTDLAFMIRGLIDPSAAASAQMQALGLNANKVSANVGKLGLTGTLDELTEAILRNTQGGTTLASSYAGMTAQTRAYAEQILTGKMTTQDLTTATDGLSVKQGALLTSFAKAASGATGLKQTFDAAMSKMVGGATGLNVALLLGGKNMSHFRDNVKSVTDAAHGAGGSVSGWAKIQGDFNFKLSQAGHAAEAVAYSVGDALLPAATAAMGVIADFGGWLTRNKAAAVALAAVIGGTLAFILGGKLVDTLQEARDSFAELADSEVLQAAASKIAAAGQWLLNAAMDANPVMLIILAIAALVAAFVLLWDHCKAFRDFFIDMWHDITRIVADAVDWIRGHWMLLLAILIGPVALAIGWIVDHWREIVRAVGDVIDWIKDHWKLILPFIIGPMGLVVDLVVTHWHAIEDAFRDAWNWIVSIVKAGTSWVKGIIGDFTGWLEAAWNAVWSVIGPVVEAVWDFLVELIRRDIANIKAALDWFGRLGSLFAGWWDDAVRAVENGVGRIVGWVEGLPGRINSALGGLPGMMFRAGVHVIESLLHGITSMVGHVASTIGSIASKVAGFFGLSPAKEGPLSGGGAPEIRGRHFVQDLAGGMLAGLGPVTSASERVALAMNPGARGGYGGRGGERAAPGRSCCGSRAATSPSSPRWCGRCARRSAWSRATALTRCSGRSGRREHGRRGAGISGPALAARPGRAARAPGAHRPVPAARAGRPAGGADPGRRDTGQGRPRRPVHLDIRGLRRPAVTG